MKQEYMECGEIVGLHGLKGDVRVNPLCDSPDFLQKRKTLYLGTAHKQVAVERAVVHKNIVLLKLAGYDTPEAAYPLRGQRLYLRRDDVTLPAGHFFIADLLGADCIDADSQRSYGTVADVLKTGANDVYMLRDEKGVERLVPAIPDVVEEIDLDRGIVRIRPLKGLFDDED